MDRNTVWLVAVYSSVASPPARVAWIETIFQRLKGEVSLVATREGGVDRNFHRRRGPLHRVVATREGGVDRNELLNDDEESYTVATHEGGVDRNTLTASGTSNMPGRHPRGWRG